MSHYILKYFFLILNKSNQSNSNIYLSVIKLKLIRKTTFYEQLK